MVSMELMAKATTISIDPEVKEELRRYCAGGSYSEAIKRLMATVKLDRMLAGFEAALDDPDYPWIDEEDFDWD